MLTNVHTDARPEAMGDVPGICELPLTRAVVQYRDVHEMDTPGGRIEDIGLALVVEGKYASTAEALDLGSGKVKVLDLSTELVLLDWVYEPTLEHVTELITASAATHDREALLRQSVRRMPRVRVISFHGLLVDLVQEVKAVAVIRGLRAVSDFEFEFQMALANRELYARAETVFLMPSAEFIFVSSTIIKNIARHGGSVRHFVPAHVARKLASRLKNS